MSFDIYADISGQVAHATELRARWMTVSQNLVIQTDDTKKTMYEVARDFTIQQKDGVSLGNE